MKTCCIAGRGILFNSSSVRQIKRFSVSNKGSTEAQSGLWLPYVETKNAATFLFQSIINVGVRVLCSDAAKIFSFAVKNCRHELTV